MHKNKFFTGQPIFSQLLSLIPKTIIREAVYKYGTDRYYKKLKSYDHLVALLYACFHNCTSLREVTTGMQAAYNKLNHLGVKYIPRRSTLSEANAHRTEAWFSHIYHSLYRHYYGRLPDSLSRRSIDKRLFIADSTTIKLFSDILKAAGCIPCNGKRKGGLKAHTLIKADEDVPAFVLLGSGVSNDRVLFRHIHLPKGSIITFDKGYANFRKYHQWTLEGVTWVTRKLDQWKANVIKEREVKPSELASGVLSDHEVILGDPKNNNTLKIKARLISFHDKEKDKQLTFATNNFRMKASTIADIYKRRWQIELLFKRLKQHSPLKYFLGDNENAIKIQVWCSLITDLLVKVIQDKVKRKWSFANIAAMVRLHLMTYIDIVAFLNNPDKALLFYTPPDNSPQLQLFKT